MYNCTVKFVFVALFALEWKYFIFWVVVCAWNALMICIMFIIGLHSIVKEYFTRNSIKETCVMVGFENRKGKLDSKEVF